MLQHSRLADNGADTIIFESVTSGRHQSFLPKRHLKNSDRKTWKIYTPYRDGRKIQSINTALKHLYMYYRVHVIILSRKKFTENDENKTSLSSSCETEMCLTLLQVLHVKQFASVLIVIVSQTFDYRTRAF